VSRNGRSARHPTPRWLANLRCESIGPGAAYRRDEIDATHLNQFKQLEGLHVDRNVSVADLKGTLEYFVRELLGQEVQTRLRPHFFPFPEPSLELDIRFPGIQGGQRSRAMVFVVHIKEIDITKIVEHNPILYDSIPNPLRNAIELRATSRQRSHSRI